MAQGSTKRGVDPDFKTSMSTRYGLDTTFRVLVTAAALVGVVVLALLLVDVVRDGSSMLSLKFLTSYPSQIFPENGGIYPALIGSLWLLGLTGLISIPLGLGAAVYLEEYGQDTRINRIIEINISNLAGVPSIIYGLLGLGIFVELLAPVTGGGSVLTGALTLSLLILPIIIVSTREALR
jgi:phosphate transport system permease protein